jgi:hypothetical protein
VDDPFPARPQGASQIIQYGVAVLEKGTTILCGQRLVLNNLACSESINTTLKEYLLLYAILASNLPYLIPVPVMYEQSLWPLLLSSCKTLYAVKPYA